MTNRLFLAGILACLSVVVAGDALAATATYSYDALGRLTGVTYADGKFATYDYDPAGNRKTVVSGTQAGVPSWITVPTNSATGSYSVSWGTATGTVTAYELYEANNPSFSGATRVYTGTGFSAALSGRGDGTYYYRARACFNSACGGYVTGSNPVAVSIPVAPGVPSFISVPPNSATGSYSINWGSATGTVTAYELYEATNASFTGQTLVYSGVGFGASLSGRANGTYYYRARACNGVGCSTYTAGGNVTVAIPVPIQVLNPAISVGATQTTQITTLANLNGNAATIESFSETCSKASVVIQGGGQSLTWTNDNTFLIGCALGKNQQCTASYVIRNTSSGQTYPGTAAITVIAQGEPNGGSCP